jgi:hypothetical protein
MLKAITYFTQYGLKESQVIFLLQRIGDKEMFNRFNKAVIFNREYDNKNSKFYRQKTWFDNNTGNEIKSLGGYLYEKVFPELK